jgi:hypothetical protein
VNPHDLFRFLVLVTVGALGCAPRVEGGAERAVRAPAIATQTTPEPRREEPADDAYEPLSRARFEEIEALMAKREVSPIELAEIARVERIKFHIDSYTDEMVERYPAFAFEKMDRFEESRVSEAQRPRFEVLVAAPHTRANMFAMMTIMSDRQIQVVGY